MRIGIALLLAMAVASCRGNGDKPSGTGEPNPIASTRPAPLAAGSELLPRPVGSGEVAGRVGIPADSAGRLIVPDAGAPAPEPLRPDRSLERDQIAARDAIGLTLLARWEWRDVPAPGAEPEAERPALDAALEKTRLSVTIDLLTVGRMRIALTSVAFPLPLGTELRARSDRYGHVLVWPGATAYRVLAPGALRSVFAERRADATPLVEGTVKGAGAGTIMGLATRSKVITTPTGKLTLDQAEIAMVGSGGPLLCRALLEFVAAGPASTVCRKGHVPLAAKFEWVGGGGLGFSVTVINRRGDLPIGDLLVPPGAAQYKPAELPPEASGVFLTLSDLAKFRRTAVPRDEPAAEGPGEGLFAVNRTDTLRYVLVDGVPIAWVRPREQQYVIGPKAGRYSVSWRDFLGQDVTPAAVVHLPDRVVVGKEADAGAP